MSQVFCWECEESYAIDEVLDIPILGKNYTAKWCFNCVMKQLEWSDYRLVKKPEKYKKFKIKSIEDGDKEYQNIQEEVILCFELQIRKLNDVDESWGDVNDTVREIWSDTLDSESVHNEKESKDGEK